MSIELFTTNLTFDPEMTRAMGLAYDAARRDLGLADRFDGATQLVADTIIELARRGERDPGRLRAGAVNYFRNPAQRS